MGPTAGVATAVSNSGSRRPIGRIRVAALPVAGGMQFIERAALVELEFADGRARDSTMCETARGLRPGRRPRRPQHPPAREHPLSDTSFSMTDSLPVEFRKALVPDELGRLLDFDRKAFARYPADLFDERTWMALLSYWLIVDGVIVGCTALEQHMDYDGSSRPGALFISSTGVLPEFQGRGYGKLQKQWQIEYARKNGFTTVVTNMRESNQRIILLNEQFGFARRKLHTNYYKDPAEAALVMELRIT